MSLQSFSALDLVKQFKSWRELFSAQRDFLIALDGQVGDSDLGITMSKAFAAAADAVDAEGADAGLTKLLRTAGATMARTAPSTMGTLTATGFLRASKAVEGKNALDAPDMALFWRAFSDGIAERGKSKPGDKTIIDVLDPVAVSLAESAGAGKTLPDAMRAAAEASAAALEQTKAMVAQHGKAAAFQQKTLGLQDAGATVGHLLIRNMADFIERG
jgi:dihydroxyacetone kinase-like protein